MKTFSKTIKFLFAFAFIECIMYGVAAFCYWDFHPGNWGMIGRIFSGVFGTAIAVIIASAYSGFYDDIEKWNAQTNKNDSTEKPE